MLGLNTMITLQEPFKHNVNVAASCEYATFYTFRNHLKAMLAHIRAEKNVRQLESVGLLRDLLAIQPVAVSKPDKAIQVKLTLMPTESELNTLRMHLGADTDIRQLWRMWIEKVVEYTRKTLEQFMMLDTELLDNSPRESLANKHAMSMRILLHQFLFKANQNVYDSREITADTTGNPAEFFASETAKVAEMIVRNKDLPMAIEFKVTFRTNDQFDTCLILINNIRDQKRKSDREPISVAGIKQFDSACVFFKANIRTYLSMFFRQFEQTLCEPKSTEVAS